MYVDTRVTEIYVRSSIAILLACVALPAADAREWKDSSGQYAVQAELVRVVDDRVELRRTDGTLIAVPVAKLSAADQQYLKSLQPDPEPVALTLVRNGQAASVIVTNGRPKESQTLAAAEVQEHIRIMSGATLPIVKESDLEKDSATVLILVGQSDLAAELGVNT
jgi:hypothetical protein